MGRVKREVSYLEIRNWEKYQHYHDRRPPWVKLYGEILDDYEWTSSDYRSRLLAVLLLILSGRLANVIPNDPQWIAGHVAMRTADVKTGLARLKEIRFIQEVPRAVDASEPASEPLATLPAEPLADRLQDASAHARPPTRGEADRTETEEEQGAKAPLSSLKNPTERELDVYNHWRASFAKNRHNYDQPSEKRLKAIRKALKSHTSGELCLAIDGLIYEQPQWWVQHHEPWVIFRDTERVEHLLELEETKPLPAGTNGGQVRKGMSPADIVAYTKGRA